MSLIIAFSNSYLGTFDKPKQQYTPLPERVTCTLERVIDGDTVVANCMEQKLRIRLIGIDAPEMGQKPWGERSKQALAEHLPQSFILHNHGQDVYDRTLGTLYAQKQDINLWMIEQGEAVAYDGKDTPRDYYLAEQQARESKLGIWAKSGDQQDPKTWRRYHQ